jgi:hypothetical protein
LLLPFQWLVEDTRSEFVFSFIWMAALMVPVGFWGARNSLTVGSPLKPGAMLLGLFGGIAILGAGLALVPHAFGMPSAPVRDWLAAACGLVSGALLTSMGERMRLQRLRTER